MYTIKETNIIVNFAALIKAGLDKMMADFIAKKLAAFRINEVAISDEGVHIDMKCVVTMHSKAMIFKFVA